MSRNRLFNLLIASALVIVIALTVQEAAATASIMSETDFGVRASECASLPSRYSLHTVYVQEMGVWVPYTEDGPTGVDGGLIYLLSNYRTCSQ